MTQHPELDGDEHDDEVEQLAETNGQTPSPRGEHRDSSTFLFGRRFSSRSSRSRGSQLSRPGVDVDVRPPPTGITRDWQRYYRGFSFTQAALKLFDEMVIEPGYSISCEIDGETDEDMKTALELWADNCVIHAGEPHHDLIHLLKQLPSKRRGKPAAFIEKVGTEDDPDVLAGLMLLDPSTVTMYTRENQTLLVQPKDTIGDPEHPRTPGGEPAAFVQYDSESLTGSSGFDRDSIPFAADDVVKLTWDPDDGHVWGSTIWEAIGWAIDGLLEVIHDREASIRMAGWPHRIYSGDWTQDEANEFADAHEKGESSAFEKEDEDADSFAGRVDYVPEGSVEIETVTGDVPDLDSTIRDYIEAIFSPLPVSKLKIAYEEDINQFVAEPQMEKDDRYIDSERRYLERKFEPIFQEKADELAGGAYEGDVEWRLAQPEDENPLEREDFDADRFSTAVGAFADFVQSGADTIFPPELVYWLANVDPEEFHDELDLGELDSLRDGEAPDMEPPGDEQGEDAPDEDEPEAGDESA